MRIKTPEVAEKAPDGDDGSFERTSVVAKLMREKELEKQKLEQDTDIQQMAERPIMADGHMLTFSPDGTITLITGDTQFSAQVTNATRLKTIYGTWRMKDTESAAKLLKLITADLTQRIATDTTHKDLRYITEAELLPGLLDGTIPLSNTEVSKTMASTREKLFGYLNKAA